MTEFVNEQRLLITGANGFLGRAVAVAAARSGWRLALLDRRLDEFPSLEFQGLETELPDRRVSDLCREFQPTACIHCAGSASVPDSLSNPAKDFECNTVVTQFLLETLKRSAPECRTVLLSSAAVYGQPEILPISETVQPAPVSPYGFHKWQAELSIREYADIHRMNTAACRIFSAYGAGLRRQVLWDLCRKASSAGPLRLMGTGLESRDFIHGDDVARAALCIIESAPMRGEVYNVASGAETTIRDLAGIILRCLVIEKPIEFDGVLPDGTPARWRADISRIRRLGFAPGVAINDGVAAFVNWFRGEP